MEASSMQKPSFKRGVGNVSPSRVRLPVSTLVGACSDGGAAFIIRALRLLIVCVCLSSRLRGVVGVHAASRCRRLDSGSG